jgi:hypothetical protein
LLYRLKAKIFPSELLLWYGVPPHSVADIPLVDYLDPHGGVCADLFNLAQAIQVGMVHTPDGLDQYYFRAPLHLFHQGNKGIAFASVQGDLTGLLIQAVADGKVKKEVPCVRRVIFGEMELYFFNGVLMKSVVIIDSGGDQVLGFQSKQLLNMVIEPSVKNRDEVFILRILLDLSQKFFRGFSVKYGQPFEILINLVLY